MAECSISQCTRRALKRKHKITSLRWLEVDCGCYCTITDADFRFLRKMNARRLQKLRGIRIHYAAITDKTGIMIADIIAKSSSIQECVITAGRITTATYSAIAKALHTNTSLSILRIIFTGAYTSDVDADFLRALNVNPRRPPNSRWAFVNDATDDYLRISNQIVVVKKERTELSRLSDAYSSYWRPSGPRRRRT